MKTFYEMFATSQYTINRHRPPVAVAPTDAIVPEKEGTDSMNIMISFDSKTEKAINSLASVMSRVVALAEGQTAMPDATEPTAKIMESAPEQPKKTRAPKTAKAPEPIETSVISPAKIREELAEEKEAEEFEDEFGDTPAKPTVATTPQRVVSQQEMITMMTAYANKHTKEKAKAIIRGFKKADGTPCAVMRDIQPKDYAWAYEACLS